MLSAWPPSCTHFLVFGIRLAQCHIATVLPNLPQGATICAAVTGKPDGRLLLTSSGGYGFIGRIEDLQTQNKAGKAVLNTAKTGEALEPVAITNPDASTVGVATNSGKLLVFSIEELPQLARGKGVKLMGVKLAQEEAIVGIAPLAPGQALVIQAGSRHLTLKPADLKMYAGTRGLRGKALPRGFQRVAGIRPAQD